MASPAARVVGVSLNPRHTFSKHPQPSIRLLAGMGVQGDAHCGTTVQHLYLKRKNPAAPNRMQVHLLQAELLDELAEKGFSIAPGELGENILTRGIDLLALRVGTHLRLDAEAIVKLTCLNQSCAQIEKFRPGLQQHMYMPTGSSVKYRVGVMGGGVLQSGAVTMEERIASCLPETLHYALAT